MKKTLSALALCALTATASAQSILYPQHFDLKEVRLLDGPLKQVMAINNDHLLQYDADRLMAPFIRQAGLDQVEGGKYEGWLERHPSFQNWGLKDWSLEGHVGGHYITALALAIAASDDTQKAEVKAMKARLDYCLRIMKDCQDAYKGNKEGMEGFIGGQPINEIWTGLYRGDLAPFRKYGGWVPFYCQHKVLAGLRDAYVYTGNKLARELFRGLSDWSVNLVANLSDEQMQYVLGWEHGGMNETLADAYAIFKDQRYLDAARKYSHQHMVKNMQEGYSPEFLSGKHANTQVPKYIGFERITQLGGEANYDKAAQNFWHDVAHERTVCIGGNSVGEHFLSKKNAGIYITNLEGPESCNSNNMLKLSEDLFDTTHDMQYADFYEGTMYNHMLSTQDPQTGGYVYFTTLRPQGYRIYSQVNQGMWCCVGTGMENHSKYGHFIYTHDRDTLFVNLFTASQLSNKRFGLKQETRFPYEPHTRLTITKGGTYTLAIRHPEWTTEDYEVRLNGVKQQTSGKALAKGQSGAFYIKARFKAGDVVDVDLPMEMRLEECPGLSDYVAIKYGPILLGARTTHGEPLQNEYGGEGRMDHSPGARANALSIITSPLLICERNEVLGLITPKDKEQLTFTLRAPRDAKKIAKNYFATHDDITLEPFFAIHHDRYMCYWYQQPKAAFDQSDMGLSEAEAERLAERTLDFVGTGEQQSEAGHESVHSDCSTSGSYQGEHYRDARANGYMQYVLNIPSDMAATLTPDNAHLAIMCRFITADRGRKGTITVNGTKLADMEVAAKVKGQDDKGFYNVEYPLPTEVLFDKDGKVRTRLTFRLTASSATLCPGLYYLRLVK